MLRRIAPGYPFGTDWANIHNGPGVEALPDNITMGAGFATGVLGFWAILARSIMTFFIDPAKVPIGSTITKVTYNWWVIAKAGSGLSAAWALVQSNPTNSNNLVPADYQLLQSTAISNVINYADVVFHAYNVLQVLNANLGLVIPGTILELGFREANYDMANIEPHPNLDASVDIFTVEGTNPPYLEVTFIPP
jgi:hypothetical protein